VAEDLIGALQEKVGVATRLLSSFIGMDYSAGIAKLPTVYDMLARSYDLHCVQISKSADLRTDCAKRKSSWHNRLQCKSYRRYG